MTVVSVRPITLRPATAHVAQGSRMLGFGAAQPATAIGSAEIGSPFGRSAEWIETRTGIQQVRRLREGESIVDLAVRAAQDALRNARRLGTDVDLVLGATCSRWSGTPELAAQVAARLAPTAAVLDLNAACSGFCYATTLADGLIKDGSARHVLVVAAEHMSSLIDPEDLGTAIIFADGAGAAVMGASETGPAVWPAAWGSDGSLAEMIEVPEGESALHMQGQQVFRWAVDTAPELARRACAKAGVTLDQIEVFVPHQANLRITNAIVTKLGLDRAVIADDIVVSGNTSAASIPIALTRLIEQRRVRPGQLALLAGFGAGLAYAAQVIRLP